MCGDSTILESVDALMNDQKADMVFTDPPYGMNLNADFSDMDSKFKGSDGGNKYEQVIGDNDDFKPEWPIKCMDRASNYAGLRIGINEI
jgi:DNA modification methylase